jgi:hypothetical protein
LTVKRQSITPPGRAPFALKARYRSYFEGNEMLHANPEKVHSCTNVILCKNGKEHTMSYGAFDRIELEAMSTPSRAVLNKQLLSGETVTVRLVDSLFKQGTVRLAH